MPISELKSGPGYQIVEGPLQSIYNVTAKSIAKDAKYGALQPLIEDDNLEEIMVLGAGLPVYVYHRYYGMCETNIAFKEEAEIGGVIDKMAAECGRRLDANNPLLDARLPDGSRINATYPSISLNGYTLTIRKFLADPLTTVDLIRFGTLDIKAAALLWLAVEGMGFKSSNIIVSGSSGSGKTTTLNCLGIFIPAVERAITIEDTIELQLPVKHKINLEARPPGQGASEITMDMLLKNALRMRPDRIIMGELRADEAKTFFAAINTGHDGSMATLHSNSARETLTRLMTPPMSVPTPMMSALDLIVMQNIFFIKGKTRRRITEIAETGGVEEGRVLLNNIFEYDPHDDSLKETGTPSVLKQDLASKGGLSISKVDMELEKRELLLSFLAKKGITKQAEVYRWIQEYYSDQKAVFDRIQEEVTAE